MCVVMIRCINISGAQCKGPHAHHGQRPHEWDLPQYKYYGPVEQKDQVALKVGALCYLPDKITKLLDIVYNGLNWTPLCTTGPTLKRSF